MVAWFRPTLFLARRFFGRPEVYRIFPLRNAFPVTRPSPALALLALWISAFFSPLTAAEVTSVLEPKSVPAGEGATLQIRVTNGAVTAVTPPEVPDLIFRGPQQSRRYSNINGVQTSLLELSYAVGSMTPGEYRIPPFEVTVDGAIVTTEAFQLTVTPSARQTPQGLPPPNPGAAAADATENPFGWLNVELAGKNRSHIWVGEMAPVRIQAWLPAEAHVSILNPLQPAGSSFTLHHLQPRPQQNHEMRNGQRYLVLTWFGGLSATKASTSPPDLVLKLDMQVPDPGYQPDPGMNPRFARRMAPHIQKEVELRTARTDGNSLEIRSLPDAGKPAGFQGAVGKFQFARIRIPAQWTTGDPAQVAAEVTGEGNFQLLAQPEFVSRLPWKSYGGQSSFAAGDAASFSGTTTWQFNQVPRKAGKESVHLEFSYFDPDQAAYQIAASAPQEITITGEDLPPELETAPADATSLPDPSQDIPTLRPVPDMTRPMLPMAWRPAWKWALPSLCGALVAVGAAGLLRRLWWLHPERLARKKLRHILGQSHLAAQSAASQGDLDRFLIAARELLQIHYAHLWQRPAASITLADLQNRLPPGASALALFRQADAVEYSGGASLPREPLPYWQSLLELALAPEDSSQTLPRAEVPEAVSSLAAGKL